MEPNKGVQVSNTNKWFRKGELALALSCPGGPLEEVGFILVSLKPVDTVSIQPVKTPSLQRMDVTTVAGFPLSITPPWGSGESTPFSGSQNINSKKILS